MSNYEKITHSWLWMYNVRETGTGTGGTYRYNYRAMGWSAASSIFGRQ